MKKKLLEMTEFQPINDTLDFLLINDFSLISQPLPNDSAPDVVGNAKESEDSTQQDDEVTSTDPGIIPDAPKDLNEVNIAPLSLGLKYVLADDQDDLVLQDPDESLFLVVGKVSDPTFAPYFLFELIGNSRDNHIVGNSGNNLLDGKAGIDTLSGGKGDDVYIVNDVADIVIEHKRQGDYDKVIATVNYELTDNVEILELVGKENLSGSGNKLDNKIKGNWGNNQIFGDAGDDSLRGNLGEDTLTGGAGDDVFIFSQRDFSGGADLITDFEVGKDKIVVSNLVGPFHHYTKEDGPLSFSFESGENIDATNTNGALFSYNTKTGKLYFDHDGAGGDDAIHFATLKNAPVFTAADLEVKNIYIPPCAVGDDNPYDFFVYN